MSSNVLLTVTSVFYLERSVQGALSLGYSIKLAISKGHKSGQYGKFLMDTFPDHYKYQYSNVIKKSSPESNFNVARKPHLYIDSNSKSKVIKIHYVISEMALFL